MQQMGTVLPWLLGGLGALMVIAALRRPLKLLGGVCVRTLGGLLALLAFGQMGPLIGVTLGVNLTNALVLGVLGAPGFGLLLMLNWALAA